MLQSLLIELLLFIVKHFLHLTKIRTLIILVSMTVVHMAIGQRSTIDSLNAVLDTISTPKSKVNTLHKLAMEYRFRSPDTVSFYALEGLKLAKEIQYQTGMAFSYQEQAISLGLKTEYPEALVWLDSAITIVEKLNNLRGQIRLLRNKFQTYHLMGEIELALACLKTSLAIADKHHLKKERAQVLRFFGMHYDWFNRYDSALYYYDLAFQLNQQIANPAELAAVEYLKGTMLLRKSDYALAFESLQSAYEIARENNDSETEVMALNGIATICSQIGLYEKGTEVLKKLEEASAAGNMYMNRADILVSLASIYLDSNKPDLAYSTASEAIQLHLDAIPQPGFAKAYLLAAQATLQLGEITEAIVLFNKGKNVLMDAQLYEASLINNALASIYQQQGTYHKAVSLVNENLKIKNQVIFPDVLTETYRIQAEIALTRSDFRKAYDYQLLHQAYSDSVLNKEKANALIRGSIAFDIKRNNLELEVAQGKLTRLETQVMLQNERNKTLVLLVSTLILIALTLLLWRFYRIRVKRLLLEKSMQRVSLEKENERIRNESLETELEHKRKVVMSQALQLAQKNESIIELRKRIELEMKAAPSDAIKKTISIINSQVNSDKDWEVFKRSFESVYSNFFVKLKDQFHSLTPREMQLCALLRLNLSIKEMSNVLGISQEGVKKARYRIRKKLELTDSNENLSAFLMTF